VDSFTWVDQLMFGMHGKIERFGWTGMYVFGEPETRTPAWGYTIGLAERSQHPELVIVGLDDCCVADLFDVLATRVSTGERLDDLPAGRVIVEGHACRVVPVHSSHWSTDRFNMWLQYYGGLGAGTPPQEALQVLWPDAHDRLPGDPGFDRRCRELQTRLDRPAGPQPRDRPRRAA
jgi:Domain of unknown function (DUF4262)